MYLEAAQGLASVPSQSSPELTSGVMSMSHLQWDLLSLSGMLCFLFHKIVGLVDAAAGIQGS